MKSHRVGMVVVVGCIAVMAVAARAGVSVATRISAAKALDSARSLAGPPWQLAFISNTGVTDSVTSSRFGSPQQALMQRDGSAGQWVVEFFMDTPKEVRDGARRGRSYPLRRFLVTAQGASELAEAELAVPKGLAVLKPACLNAVDAARNLAIAKVRNPFQVMSVASQVSSDGTCSWAFRFYDLASGAIVGKVLVSGDGTRELVAP